MPPIFDRPFVILLLAAVVPSLAAYSQATPPAAEFEGEVRVTEVLLDVLVTDPQGNVVVGLGEEDFVVEEEGRPVPIESVSFYSNRSFVGGPGGGEAAAGAPLAERWFVLFVYRPPVALARDDDRALYLKLPQVGKESFEWLVGDLLPGDHVAVVSYVTRLTLHHDFSRDRDRLGRAIRRAAMGQPPERWPSRTEAPQPGVTLAPLFAREDLAEATADLHDAVRLLAEEMGTIAGRKNLVLFGADFPRLDSPESRAGYPAMVEALNAHNVAAYGVSVTGRGRQPSLARLAEDTGGRYAYGFTSFLEPLRRIAVENSGYYLVSFRSQVPAGETGYREVAVSTVNESFEVRTRSGYRYGD